jgi:ribosomal protein L9
MKRGEVPEFREGQPRLHFNRIFGSEKEKKKTRTRESQGRFKKEKAKEESKEESKEDADGEAEQKKSRRCQDLLTGQVEMKVPEGVSRMQN